MVDDWPSRLVKHEELIDKVSARFEMYFNRGVNLIDGSFCDFKCEIAEEQSNKQEDDRYLTAPDLR